MIEYNFKKYNYENKKKTINNYLIYIFINKKKKFKNNTQCYKNSKFSVYFSEFNFIFSKIRFIILGKFFFKSFYLFKKNLIKNNINLNNKNKNLIHFNKTNTKKLSFKKIDNPFLIFNKINKYFVSLENKNFQKFYFKNIDYCYKKINSKIFFYATKFKPISLTNILFNNEIFNFFNMKKNQFNFSKFYFLKVFIKYNFFNDFSFIYIYIIYKFKYFNKVVKKPSLNKIFELDIVFFLKYLLFINDINIFKDFDINYNFVSNNLLKNFFGFFNYNNSLNFNFSLKKKFKIYNNYYPVFFLDNVSYNKYFSKFKNNYDIDFLSFTNKFVINFFEKNFKKNIFIKFINNYYNKINNYYLESILYDHKKFQPAFWKTFLVNDFIKILWYSFFLKDLSMISNWISIFMETMHFKNHKKFLSFFSNFINKYSDIFTNILKIKGFFFDIRGKVGVTGSSKKRHLFFKFGSINKSSKKTKINFNQNLVRTYSGVLGLTYIINF